VLKRQEIEENSSANYSTSSFEGNSSPKNGNFDTIYSPAVCAFR